MSPYFQVDTFTREPFHGNPAVVCVVDAMPDRDWMQAVAAELLMPASAFVAGAGQTRELRWFTSTTELELCGHGTVAAAHVLWETESLATLLFTTPAGPIAAHRRGDASFITLEAGDVAAAEPSRELLAAVGVSPVGVWRTPLDYLVELDDASAVVSLAPDLDTLARVETRGLIVTAEGGEEGVDFTSRFFAPRLGLPEDSVTGSAHASLGPFWAQRLGRTTLRARQASKRGGYVDLIVDGDTVDVGGPALTVARGELRVTPPQPPRDP